jgi:hypothetical protein
VTDHLDAARAHAATVVDTLTPQQVADLAAGRARLVFQPQRVDRRPRPAAPEPATRSSDIAGTVEMINQLSDPEDVEAYLRRHDAAFTVPLLRAIAAALGPTVRTTGRNKAELRRDIIAGTVGYRTRAEAMSGGAWS